MALAVKSSAAEVNIKAAAAAEAEAETKVKNLKVIHATATAELHEAAQEAVTKLRDKFVAALMEKEAENVKLQRLKVADRVFKVPGLTDIIVPEGEWKVLLLNESSKPVDFLQVAMRAEAKETTYTLKPDQGLMVYVSLKKGEFSQFTTTYFREFRMADDLRKFDELIHGKSALRGSVAPLITQPMTPLR